MLNCVLVFSFLDTPKRQDGVSFCQHFIKHFIRPYELLHFPENIADTTLGNRLKTINCEFMLRPHVGFSEISETVTEN